MTGRILVAYASAFGSTATVAEAIGQTLRDAGLQVDVRSVIDVASVAPYQAVIVGSAIYNGAWLPEAVHFVQVHADALSRMPVAYWLVCATMRENTAEHRQGARSFLDPVLTQAPQVQPVDIGLFAGRIEPTLLPWPVRVRMWLAPRLRRGDDRSWDEIRRWTMQIVPQLSGAAPAAERSA